jgi:hypothetical protein
LCAAETRDFLFRRRASGRRPLATFTSVLLIDTAAVGVTVSTVKLAVLPPAPALPFPSCQEPAVTLTVALLMSVLAAPVKVAV